jgi:hypothetical protein
MASTVRIKTHGNTTLEGIELENFSTEETLAALLEQFKAFSAAFKSDTTDKKTKTEKSQTKLEKWLAALGGGAAGVGAAGGSGKIADVVTKMMGPVLNMFIPLVDLFESIAALTPEVILAAAAFKVLSIGLSIFQGALNIVSRSITSLFSISGNLVNTFLSGKTAMSDYISAIQRGTASIPLVGTFFSLLASGAALLEGWNQTLVELTKVGGNFGGNISNLVMGAADAGLSVEQFASVIKENAEQLSTFGTLMNGVNTYTRVSKISMQEYSSQLSALGISFSQYSEELPRILGLFGASMKAHGASDRDLAQSAINLTAQFDAMGQITGKTREQQANDLAQLTQDAAWQRSMTKMTKQEQEGYLTALNEISSTSGKAYAELYKLSVIGMPPLTKELQILLATTPGLNTEFQRMTAAVKSGIKGAELGAKMDDIAADMVANGLRAGQTFETLIAASTAGLGSADAIANAQKDLLAHSKEFFDADGNFQEDRYRAQLSRDRKRAAAEDGVSQKLLGFSNLFTAFREDFYIKVVGPLLTRLAGPISAIVDSVSKNAPAFTGIIDMVVKVVQDFADWINSPTTDVKGTIDSFISTIKNIVSITIGAMQFVWGVIKFVADNWSVIKPIINFLVGMVLGVALVTIVGGFLALASIIGPLVTGFGSLLGLIGGGGAAAVAGGGAAAVAGGGAVLAGETAAAGGGAALAGEAGGLAALVGTEAASGIGIPLAVATGAVGGGVLLWQYLANKKKEEQKQNVEKTSYTQSAPVDSTSDAMASISEYLATCENLLRKIVDNTDMISRSSKKTAGAVA